MFLLNKSFISPILFTLLIILNLFSSGFGLLTSRGFICWIIIEIRILSFVGILRSTGFVIRKYVVGYYSIQVIPSIIILILISLSFEFRNYCWEILTIIILLKLGVAPFHLWYTRVASSLPWGLMGWLFTVQKLIPLRILSIIYSDNFIAYFIILSVLIRVTHIVAQIAFKKILILSSVFSINWVIGAIITSSMYLWIKYFLIYRFVLILIILIVAIKGQLIGLGPPLGLRHPLFVLILVLALIKRGFPPRPIFFIKISILIGLVHQSHIILSLGLIISSGVRILAYVNILASIISFSYFSNYRRPKISSSILIVLLLTLIFLYFFLWRLI